MAAMTAASNVDPSFNDMIIVSDIIDTIRADDRLVDIELSAEDRRKALIQRLKEQKQKEGVDVSEDVIAAAVDRLNEQRFAFKPMKPGFNRALATLYVRRSRYMRNTAIAVCMAVVGVVGWRIGYDQLVVKPRIAQEQRMAAEKAAVEKELQTSLAVRLPSQLKAAYSSAQNAATEAGDSQAVAEINSRKTEVEGAIAARDVRSAERGIGSIRDIEARVLQRRERKAFVDRANAIVDEANAARDRYLAAGNRLDSDARATLDRRLSVIREAAERGDVEGFSLATRAYTDLVTYAENDAEIRIVNRRGVRAGVEKNNGRYLYLIVEALVGGKPVPVDIGSIEDGNSEIVPYWGIRVSQRQYNKVLADYSDDKIIDNAVAGFKPKGSLAVQWRIDTVNDQAITRW